jgi:hypothetical protein
MGEGPSTIFFVFDNLYQMAYDCGMDASSRSLFKYASMTSLTAGILMAVMVVLMHVFPYANMLKYEQVRPVAE